GEELIEPLPPPDGFGGAGSLPPSPELPPGPDPPGDPNPAGIPLCLRCRCWRSSRTPALAPIAVELVFDVALVHNPRDAVCQSLLHLCRLEFDTGIVVTVSVAGTVSSYLRSPGSWKRSN
ncbi:hypothetical protein PENTCL1PPCAC_23967, partial [Pristionchus entomophagus]